MKEIGKTTSDRTGVSEHIYKAIANIVFTSLAKQLRRPPSLIIRLRGVGCWYLRKKRLDIVVNEFPPDFNKRPEDFESKYGVMNHESKVELHNLFSERLKEYDKYLQEKAETRKIRYTTQPPLIPLDDDND